MDKRKWLWKRKPSERSPGETESSGSISSHSERYSDDQEGSKASPNHRTQSPEVTSKATASGDEIDDSVKILTEKLSAALINVSAKEDLVKQHAKVAEEAVEGWEKAENEVALLKQQLEAAVQKNLALEDRANHLDGALKECVRQLRQGREEQEQKILGAVLEKTHEWEFIKVELETQLECLERENSALKQTQTKSPTSIDPDLLVKLEFLERENSTLKLKLLSQSEELELRTIERDLSAQAAETASKQHLESIKKVAKLEAECRRLQVLARKFPPDQKSVSVSSICVESLTDSQSDSGEKLNALEMDFPRTSRSNLTTEVDQLKNENVLRRSITGSSLEIDMMDDFLEMERLAALPESETKNKIQYLELDNDENQFKNDFEAKDRRIIELEEKIKKIEAEKAELEEAVATSRSSYEESQFQLKDAEMRLEAIKKELAEVNESRELLEFQLTGMEVETRTMSSKVDTLMEEIKKEQSLSAEMAIQCQELQNELAKKSKEIELQQAVIPKLEQEELNVAAGKLAECQKTIASLGRQLQSLATLEDFLIDTANLPGFSGENELWKLHSNETCMLKSNSELKELVENSGASLDGNDENSQASSSASSSHISGTKSRNGFGKLFTRSKSGIQLENQQS